MPDNVHLNEKSGPITTVREATCPACGYHVATSFYQGGCQPLATLAWPKSPGEAAALPRFPLDFVRCVDCGHVFNASFDYKAVPYSEKPNLMYNRGQIWAECIRDLQREIISALPADPTVVEIGYGDGSFLGGLATLCGGGRYVGFDPNGARKTFADNLSLRQELFDPLTHLQELKPDLLISRHVLEHLTNPLGFLQSINFAASALGIRPRMYFEVPCIDRAIESMRTVDFYYEHNSHFTTASFHRMLKCSGVEIETTRCSYAGEVIYGFVRAAPSQTQLATASETAQFHNSARTGHTTVGLQLLNLHLSDRRVAIWGGTGKSAAFLNHYGLDSVRFPIVVDSDPDKVGTFVPGTGQEIRHRDWLLEHPADVIIIPPQWRAADIIREMHSAGIQYKAVWIEDHGMLIDYFADPHPYRSGEICNVDSAPAAATR